jgi:hypothetical protein
MIPPNAPPGGPKGGKDAGAGGDAEKKTMTGDEYDKLPPADQAQWEPDGKGGYKKKEAA